MRFFEDVAGDSDALEDWPFYPAYDPLDYPPARDARPAFPQYNPLEDPPPLVQHPPLIRQIWSGVKARAGQKALDVAVLAVLLAVTYPIVAWVAAWYEAHQ